MGKTSSKCQSRYFYIKKNVIRSGKSMKMLLLQFRVSGEILLEYSVKLSCSLLIASVDDGRQMLAHPVTLATDVFGSRFSHSERIQDLDGIRIPFYRTGLDPDPEKSSAQRIASPASLCLYCGYHAFEVCCGKIRAFFRPIHILSRTLF